MKLLFLLLGISLLSLLPLKAEQYHCFVQNSSNPNSLRKVGEKGDKPVIALGNGGEEACREAYEECKHTICIAKPLPPTKPGIW